MDKSQLYWLFLDFIGGDAIEIEGLYLKPERILKDGNTIAFSIENPNDTSYYIGVITDYLDELLFDFSKFTNHMFKYHIDSNYPELYFNKSLKSEIKRVLQSITTLKLVQGYNDGDIITVIKGNSVGFNIESNYDQITIWNEFEAKSGKVYNETKNNIITTDLIECIDQYLDTIELTSGYLESDVVYQKLDTVLEGYPLISTDWIAQVYHTEFKNLS
jgi:hypothetical protein